LSDEDEMHFVMFVATIGPICYEDAVKRENW